MQNPVLVKDTWHSNCAGRRPVTSLPDATFSCTPAAATALDKGKLSIVERLRLQKKCPAGRS